jgi:hypothetical protein
MSSGAMYNGVPLIEVNMCVALVIIRANPKSHNFAFPVLSNNTFCGFKSLENEKNILTRE